MKVPTTARERIGLYVWVSLFGLIAIGFGAFVLRFPFLRYARVEISGETAVTAADIIADLRAYPLANTIGRFLGYDHFFLWGNTSIALPEFALARVEVSRDFLRRTLRVTVIARERTLVWCDDSFSCVWVDSGGTAFERAPFADGQLVTRVTESAGASPTIGMTVLPAIEFARLLRAVRIAQAVSPLRDILFNRKERIARIALENGPTLFFNLRIEPEFAETALAALFSREDFRDIKEIDFTVERKAYYRMSL